MPDTAETWLRPVASMASVRSCGVRLVSPTTRAGTRPRASVHTPSVASRNLARTAAAVSSTRPGAPTTRGGPSGRATATTSSPGSEGASRATTSTSSFQPRPPQVLAGAMTSTGDSTGERTPRPTTVCTPTLATTSGSPRADGDRTGRGSAVSRPVIVTAAPAAARSVIGPTARIARCAEAETSRSEVTARQSATRRRAPPGLPTRRSSTAPVRAAAAARTTVRGPTTRPTKAVTDHATATGTSSLTSSRRSTTDRRRGARPRHVRTVARGSGGVRSRSRAGSRPAVVTAPPGDAAGPAACRRCR